MSRSAKSVSIKTLIISLSLTVFFVASIIIGAIVFSNWYRLTNSNANLFAEQMESQIHKEIDQFMYTPYHVNEVNQRIFEFGLLDINDQELREQFFVDVLSKHVGAIYSTAYATVDGYYYGARINLDGEMEIMRKDATTDGRVNYYSISEQNTADEFLFSSNPFDPRTRDWYTAAVEAGGPTFSPIYKHFILDELTFSTVWPIYNEVDELVGVLANHVLLSQIDNYLADIVEDFKGTAMIFEKESGYLIANSLLEPNFTLSDQLVMQRTVFSELSLEMINDAYDQYSETGESSFKYSRFGESIYFNAIHVEDSNIDWIIITSIPASFFMSEVYRTLNITIVSIILILLIAIYGYVKLAKLLFKPLEELVELTDQVTHGKLNVHFEKKRDDEIGRLSESLDQMTKTISSLVNNLEKAVDERTIDLAYATEETLKIKDSLRLILDTTAEGIYGIDLEGNCTFINRRAIKMLGFDSDKEVIGKNMHDLIHHHHKDGKESNVEHCKIFMAMKKGLGQTSDDEVFFMKDGTQIQVRYSSYPQYSNQNIIGAVVSFVDNSDEKKRKDQIIYVSYHDHLTGLYNRRYFVETLDRLDYEDMYPIGIMMIDLNALKLFNDAFGHLIGDDVLKHVAKCILNNLSEHDIACRLSGDEFAIIIPNASEELLNRMKHRIKDQLNEVLIKGIHISVAVGYESKNSKDISSDEVFRKAENHMYKDKITEGEHVKNNTINTIMESLITKHPEEKAHAEKISEYCGQMGIALKMSEDEVNELKITGLYHDIGKISVPDELLSKPHALTSEEYEVMKKHAEVGYQILKSADQYAEFANATLCHHEHFDGGGYPRGLKGKDIPLNARIIAVVDAYEHMTSNRSYHQKMTKIEAIKELLKFSGSQFDPEIVDVFIKKVLKEKQ